MSTTLYDYWYSHPDIWFNATPKQDFEIYVLFNNYTPTNLIEEIIFYDQIQRHISRYLNIAYSKKYLDKAVKISNQCIKSLDTFSEQEIVFILLPLRHSEIKENIERCLVIIKNLINTNQHPLYIRFYKATLKDVAKIRIPVQPIPSETWNYFDLLDKKCTFNPRSKEIFTDNFLKIKFPQSRLIVSVSGGVDSMVCLYLAKNVFRLNPVAVMINYCNREQCDREVSMVSWFCHRLQIPLYVRHITEITRTRDNMRAFYENYTKSVRFNTYKQVMGQTNIPVILGHNLDDVEENIFRNIQKKRNLHNLRGMTESSIIMDVTICRPLLDISKTQIYEMASKYNVPYLQDSTPKWSERGIMRNQILPHIPRDMLIGHLKLAEYMTDMYDAVKTNVDSMNIVKTNDSYVFSDPMNDSIAFWDILFQKLKLKISRKSLEHFINIRKIRKRKTKKYKIMLNHNIYVIVNNSQIHIIQK